MEDLNDQDFQSKINSLVMPNVLSSSSNMENYRDSSESAAMDGWREIKSIERHFNEIEVRYRLLASTWVLAAFAGMGYIASNDEMPFPKECIILGIAVAASLGIQLLWVIDLLVYRRLSDANFLAGLKLEKTYPSLPQVGWLQVEYFMGQGTAKQVVFFYVGCSVVPIIFAMATFFQWCIINFSVAACTFGIIAVIIPFCLIILLWFQSHNKWLAQKIEEIDR